MHIWAPPLGRRQIRINVLHPGYLDTGLTRPSQPKSRVRAEAASVLGRIGDAGVVSRWMLDQILTPGLTGQVLQYDSRI
jgi:NAD(P)-dependent dehydrogenase (short-subunit alcohol dehydrogenase family)